MTEVEAVVKPAKKIYYRYRVTYSRGDALRYIGHLDLHLVWERTLRRAEVHLAYSQGFNKHPRLQMACALPLGFLSRGEVADFWVEQIPGDPSPNAAEILQRIQKAAPPGLEIHGIKEVQLNQPALQTLVLSADYTAVSLDALDEPALHAAADDLITADTLPRERRGKAYDLRPLIEHLEIHGAGEQVIITMRLAAREGATGRPEEVLEAMGLDPSSFRIERVVLTLSM